MSPLEIKQLRRRLGLTQEQFAARIGVDPCTVSRWETGAARPTSAAVLRALEKARAAAASSASSAPLREKGSTP